MIKETIQSSSTIIDAIKKLEERTDKFLIVLDDRRVLVH